MLTSPPPSSARSFRVLFRGAPAPSGSVALEVPAPWLGGAAEESLFPQAALFGSNAGLPLFQDGELLLGHALEPVTPGTLAERTEALYRRVLAACGRRHLYRIWNYVPRINEHADGVENYRAFCLGRARAFESALGSGFEAQLPAASAVGCEGSQLAVVFAAGPSAPRHVENPDQVPAYRYPIEHGPRSPSFARATIARDGTRNLIFISGTAAIKGHQTVAPGEIDGQLDCTLDNLRLISRAVGLGDRFTTAPGTRRKFKVYLRHPEDLQRVRTRLDEELLQPGDPVTYLHSEICRAALDVEIEATFVQD